MNLMCPLTLSANDPLEKKKKQKHPHTVTKHFIRGFCIIRHLAN